MLDLLCLRHWPTAWNLEKRLQGRRDLPLDTHAISELHGLQVPPPWNGIPWYCSPLRRARETAHHLGLDATPVDALIEMDWGRWEGARVLDLRNEDPSGMATAEARGLDLHPPGGETPRQVQKRVTTWAETLHQGGTTGAGALCHKGVIRALLAAACDWDMLGKAPVRLDYRRLQHFRWDGNRWRLIEANLPLVSRS